MKKLLFLTLLFAILNGKLFSQNDYDELDSVFTNPFEVESIISPNPCITSKIECVSQIPLTNGNTLVYIRYSDFIPSSLISTIPSTNAFLNTQNLSSREVLIEKPTLFNEISISQFNSCGFLVSGSIFTKPVNTSAAQDNSITVSPALGQLLIKYSEGNVPLKQFLRMDNSVSIFEKIAFYHAYALDGKPLPISTNQILNDYYSGDGRSGSNNGVFGDGDGGSVPPGDPNVSCKCESIISNPEHLVGIFRPNSGGEPYFFNYGEEIFENGTKKGIGSGGAKTWKQLQLLGASRWQSTHTEGYRTTRTSEVIDSLMVGTEGLANSGPRGEITVHLICMDGNQLPAECTCDKDGTFSYRYNSKSDASAILHSGGPYQSYRRAFAMAEDFGMTFCYEGSSKGANVDNLFPIEGIWGGVSAKCATEKNPIFWSTIGDLAKNVIDIFTNKNGELFEWQYKWRNDTLRTKNPVTSNDTLIITPVKDSMRVIVANPEAGRYKLLVDQIIKFINTSHFEESTCGAGTKYLDMDGYFHFKLKPNKPLTFVLMSRGKTMAGGRRSWYSRGEIKSGYSMSVVVKPGRTDGINQDCCSPWIGSYLVASPFLGDEGNHNRYVGGQLAVQGGFSPGWPNGMLNYKEVRGRAGHMSRPATSAECNVQFGPRTNQVKMKTDQINCTDNGVKLYNINGKLIGHFLISSQNGNDEPAIINHIKMNKGNIHGVFIYSYCKEGNLNNKKIVITN